MYAAGSTAYSAMFEHAPLPMILARPSGEILDANPAACDLLGYSPNELRMLGHTALVDPEDPRLVAALAELRNAGHFDGHLTLQRKNGSLVEAELSSSVFLDDLGLERACVIVRATKELGDEPVVALLCSYCQRVRVAAGTWHDLAAYVTTHFGHRFSHGICPTCYEKHVLPQL